MFLLEKKVGWEGLEPLKFTGRYCHDDPYHKE